MKIDKQMRVIIDKRKNQEDWQNDVETQEYWDEEMEILTIDLDTTINYIKNLSAEDAVWVAEVWDDLIEHFHSKELLEACEECIKKYPDSDIYGDVQDLRYLYLKYDLEKELEELQKSNYNKELKEKYLKNLKEILFIKPRLTIAFMDYATKDELYFCSLFWCEIVEYFKNNIIVENMKLLINKYPEISEILKTRYEEAKKVLEK